MTVSEAQSVVLGKISKVWDLFCLIFLGFLVSQESRISNSIYQLPFYPYIFAIIISGIMDSYFLSCPFKYTMQF